MYETSKLAMNLSRCFYSLLTSQRPKPLLLGELFNENRHWLVEPAAGTAVGSSSRLREVDLAEAGSLSDFGWAPDSGSTPE